MARPERNNVDYFPFYCEDGNKMFYIEETYGNDGFATFVKLLRELAKADHHYLNLSKQTTLMYLSAKCKITREKLEAIINDLCDLGKFDEVLWNENKIIWCQDFIDSIQDAYKKRNNKCITYDGLLLLLIGLGIRKPPISTSEVPVNPQRKEKETKEKENKENESKNDAPFLPISTNENLLNENDSPKAEILTPPSVQIFLAEEMFKTLVLKRPDAFFDKKEVLGDLRQIGEKIHKWLCLLGNYTDSQNLGQINKRWGEILDKIGNHNFFATFSILQIKNNFSQITLEFNKKTNATTFSNNGQNGVSGAIPGVGPKPSKNDGVYDMAARLQRKINEYNLNKIPE